MTVVKEGVRDDGFSDLGKDEEEYVGADADAGGDDDDDDVLLFLLMLIIPLVYYF